MELVSRIDGNREVLSEGDGSREVSLSSWPLNGKDGDYDEKFRGIIIRKAILLCSLGTSCIFLC